MESSDDCFLWSDASNDSSDDRKYIGSATSMEPPYEEDSELAAEKARDIFHILCSNENETRKMQKNTKKRKCSVSVQESSDYSEPGRKRIKLEPESDAEKKKRSRKLNNTHNNESEDCALYDEGNLSLRVKQEQLLSAVAPEVDKPKKKKKQRPSVSDIDGTRESNSILDLSRSESENGLDLRVKQEQLSSMEPVVVKSKRKKKLKNSVVSPETDIASETKSVMKFDDTAIENNLSGSTDQTEYFVIEEKFSAEETVVEKPRKKKHKREKNNSDIVNDSIYDQKLTGPISEICSDSINNNDMSVQPNDFTFNNIVCSTIINSSAIHTTINKTENLLRSNENQSTKKISDRITFEDDVNNSSQQKSFPDATSTKINQCNINLFLKAHPHLELYTPQTEEDNIITKDDEIWTLRWPHEIDIEKLTSTTLSLEGKCKIKINGHTYEGVPDEDVKRVTLLLHKRGQALVTNLPVNRCINYHKRIPKAHIPDYNIMINNQTNFIPLPETKCRHPLFGARYKKSIKIAPAVVENLNAAKQRSSKSCETSKSKKYKKDKRKLVDDVTMEEDGEHKPLKEKKRKHSRDDRATHKKPKRVKHEPHSPAAWESELAIEQNLFDF